MVSHTSSVFFHFAEIMYYIKIGMFLFYINYYITLTFKLSTSNSFIIPQIVSPLHSHGKAMLVFNRAEKLSPSPSPCLYEPIHFVVSLLMSLHFTQMP